MRRLIFVIVIGSLLGKYVVDKSNVDAEQEKQIQMLVDTRLNVKSDTFSQSLAEPGMKDRDSILFKTTEVAKYFYGN